VEVVPFIVTYNGMATGPAIKRCVEHLMTDAPTFGTAIEQIDLYAHCQTREPILTGLESMESRFQARLVTLPFIRFRRATRLFEVAYASRWVHSDNTFGSAAELSAAEFACLCREFAAALSLTRRRIKPSDAFDVVALEAHLQRRLGLVP
jgi:hypothetical protein